MMVGKLELLPQLAGDRLFLADAGLETVLIFHHGLELPAFAAFPLLEDDAGREHLRRYFRPFLELARDLGAGFVLDTATWRASADWGARLGYSAEGLDAVNRAAVAFARELGDEFRSPTTPIVIAGVIGPRGDGYDPDHFMSAAVARDYHAAQVATFADAGADMVSAVTMTSSDEALGIVLAARERGLPVAIGFTVETDGRLPSGEPLRSALERVDAESEGAAAYFMVNCAHPDHMAGAFADAGEWLDRIAGLRANASRQSHAELDEATELDDGDPQELGALYRGLRTGLPRLNVLGGCCGTDVRHVAAIGAAWDG